MHEVGLGGLHFVGRPGVAAYRLAPFPAAKPNLAGPSPALQGVRFKRVIMDESSTDRSPDPPKQPDVKRMVFCSGKVRGCACVCGCVHAGGGGGGGGGVEEVLLLPTAAHRPPAARVDLHLLHA